MPHVSNKTLYFLFNLTLHIREAVSVHDRCTRSACSILGLYIGHYHRRVIRGLPVCDGGRGAHPHAPYARLARHRSQMVGWSALAPIVLA
jgi:hypothetical protein